MNIPPEWKVLLDRKKTLEDSLRQVEREMEAIAASVLLQSLQQGKWRVGKDPYKLHITPVDQAAEDAIEEVLSRALKLGYHDTFNLTDGHVRIQGWVNDGELTLALFPDGLKPDLGALQGDLKRLHLDIDITDFIRSTTESALEFAQRELKSAQQRIVSLQAAYASLPPKEEATE